MTDDLTTTLAQSYFEDVLNEGDWETADRIFAASIVFNYPLGRLDGVEAVNAYLREFRTAFPDIHFAVAALLSDGSSAVARWSLAGTQTGIFKGRPPSNKPVSLPGITWFDMDNGRISEMWVSFNPSLLIG